MHTARHSGSARRGFTIPELLVVIFIMMAMTGIAVAAFTQFLDSERIKLAGGQVTGAIRMARQYAMSRRTKVMVEFTSPDHGMESGTVTASYSGRGVTEQRSPTLCRPNQCWSRANGNNWAWVKWDLSGLPEKRLNVTSAILTVKAKAQRNYRMYVDAHFVPDDSWDPATLCYNNRPGVGAKLKTFSVPDTAWHTYEIDVTSQVSAEASGDKGFSVRYRTTTLHYSTTVEFNGGSLRIEYEAAKDIAKETVSHLPRSVRIIPYLRKHEKKTGSYTWLLDQDSAALKEMILPRNVHYVLVPAARIVPQYDPGDLVDHTTGCTKMFLDLWPDGTCTAAAPERPELVHRLNTVWLHDAVSSDMAMLFVPPSSSFTRQRYLLGGEVQAFVDALGIYDLW